MPLRQFLTRLPKNHLLRSAVCAVLPVVCTGSCRHRTNTDAAVRTLEIAGLPWPGDWCDVINETVNNTTGARILVVEDSAPVRARIVSELSELNGIREVLEAANLATGLTLLESHHPEVAVLDLHLRSELAFPILERIRQQSLPTVAVIFSSAAAGPLRDACLRLGARAYLPKSGGFEAVAKTVEDILANSNS